MTTQECVDKFGILMETKLDENRHKGDRAGWLLVDKVKLLSFLEFEVRELRDAIQKGTSLEIASECADVANFAMMIADVTLNLDSVNK